MIASVSPQLLTQDNSIPGNRKDGFRYDHLLFVIAITPLYLWFELAFGVRLLDAMGSKVLIDDTVAIGHSGRLISGAALALFLVTNWFRQCEKNDLGLGRAAGVSVLIILLSFFAAWHIQKMVLTFYVKRSTAELPWAIGSLALLMVVGYWLYHLWLNTLSGSTSKRYFWLAVGAVLLLAAGYGQNQLLQRVSRDRELRLGIERQQTATLTVIRRGLQERLATLPRGDHPSWALESPEGKAYLALFPIFGSVYDQEALALERPRLLAEFMFRDWDTEFGEHVYAAYQQVEAEVMKRHEESYLGRKTALALDNKSVPPGLSLEEFRKAPAVTSYLRSQLGCFDCNFVLDMNKDSFNRELFKATKSHQIQQVVDEFADPESFRQGKFGERAARTYWAPILALLFSMLGVFVHVFRLIVTIFEFGHRHTFNRIGAADSHLATAVQRNSVRVTAASIIALALFTFFSDNRITGDAGYVEHRADMWRMHPFVGGIAAHWTVNAQGFIYPFTKKICPDWLRFDHDPMQSIPIVRHWFAETDYE
jgi:hypothetical protein